MTSTKRGFLKAGAIIGIVASVLMSLFSLIFIPVSNYFTEDMMLESYKVEENYNYVETPDGSYYVEYTFNGETIRVTEAEIQMLTKIVKGVFIAITIIVIIQSIPVFVLSIIMLNKLKKNSVSKGLIIALLVLSIISSNVLIMAFMIVALCLKDKPQIEPNLENINEIAKNS